MKYTKAVITKMAKTLPWMFAEGQSITEVCAELRMSTQTFYDLIQKHPEFSKAVEEGVALSQAWWERLGRQGASMVVDIQPVTWIFNMKNRFGWKDRNEITGKDGESLFAGFADAVAKNANEGK